VNFFSFEYIYYIYLCILIYIYIYNKKKGFSVCQYVVDTSSFVVRRRQREKRKGFRRFQTHIERDRDAPKEIQSRSSR